ncbi:MAG TPA: transcription termination/antitermination protein NusA, partial [Aliarcobacter cryaerophilus]|nr:transcription termination/antitermination protein NusA [Aliarcobacter cryaerophilus]
EMFIARALSPALVNSVKIEEHPKNGEKGKAVVTINSEQKSKAIGKAGLNIRLASMLTKYDIEIVEIETGVTTSNLETKKDEKISDASSLEALFK